MYVVVPNMAVVVSVRCCAQLNFQQPSENLPSQPEVSNTFQISLFLLKFHQVLYKMFLFGVLLLDRIIATTDLRLSTSTKIQETFMTQNKK